MVSAKTLTNMFIASFLFVIIQLHTEARITNEMLDTFFPSQSAPSQRWAMLVAGSKDYINYRHQADICHAWQTLTDKGVPQENIVVFMFDDIAYSDQNPFKGQLYNSPYGFNVYEGVTKDYIGDQVNVLNIVRAFLGNALPGGSEAIGKFIDSGPNDYVFFYFSGHGEDGALAMPHHDDVLLTKETFKLMLQEKQQKQGFKQMLVYIEACHGESMIDFLDNTWRIYATAASTREESSWTVYCSKDTFKTCLGDGYSVAWMEDSDAQHLTLETIGTQFDKVKERVLNQDPVYGKYFSHVVEYGLMDIKGSPLSVFQGPEGKFLRPTKKETNATAIKYEKIRQDKYETIRQDKVELWYLKGMVRRAKMGSVEREEAEKQLDDVISHRKHIDQSVIAIATVIVDGQNATSCSQVLKGNTDTNTWDWKCLKGMLASYQAECGALRLYGMNYNKVFVKLCDIGISPNQLGVVASHICLPHLVKPQWMAEKKAGFSLVESILARLIKNN